MATTTRARKPPQTRDHEGAVASAATTPTTHGAQLLRRAVAVIGLATIALVHLIDATDQFHETQYLGWAFMVLVVGCIAVAAMLIEGDDRRAWIGAIVLAAISFAAYAVSRTSG